MQSILTKVKQSTSFSAAEVGKLELLNMAELGFTSVGNEYSQMDERIESLILRLENNPSIEILSILKEVEKF